MIRKFIHRMIFEALCISSLFYSAYGSDIVSDYTENSIVVHEKNLQLSSKAKKKAVALSHYANAFITSRKTNGKINEETISNLVKTLENDPTANEAMNLLINRWKQQNKLDESVDILMSIAEKNSAAIKINLVTASILIKAKRYKDAEALLDKCYGKYVDKGKYNPQYVKLVTTLLTLNEKCSSFEKGGKVVAEVTSNPNYKNDILILTSSVDLLSMAVEESPDDDSWLWFDSSKEKYTKKLYILLKHIDLICFNKYHPPSQLIPILNVYKKKKMPEKGISILMSNFLEKPDDMATRVFLAEYLYDIKDYWESFRLWQQILSSTKANRDFNFGLGRAAFMVGEYKIAEEAFEWILAFYDKDDSQSMYYLALLYFEQGLFRKSINKLKNIIETPWGAYLTASCYQKLNKFKEASEFMKKTEILATKNDNMDFLSKEFYFNYAMILEKTGDFKLQKKQLNDLHKKYPEDPDVNNFLGYTLADHGEELDRAEELISKALKEKPDNSAYLDSLAWVLFRKGKFEEALKQMGKCIKLEDGLPDAVISDHAGDIYYALGDIENAVKYWKLAFETYSEDIDPEKIAEKLKNAD